jgi:hypothetical protein
MLFEREKYEEILSVEETRGVWMARKEVVGCLQGQRRPERSEGVT